MGPMRHCCGYYCAMIAAVAIFFFGVIIVMEIRKNQFVLYKLQYPEGEEATHQFGGKTTSFVRTAMNEEADAKVISLAIAIGLNVVCIIGCLVQVKIGEKQEASRKRQLERESERADQFGEESKEN